ncbi:MAG: hypothetical protein ACI4N6_00120 [Eubacteriales bacterium]
MKIDVFMEELKLAVVKRGVPEENAAKHAQTLRQSFDSEDLGEIEAMDSSDEIDALADSIAAILLRKKKSVRPPESQAPAEPDKPAAAEEKKEVAAVVPAQPQSVAAAPAEAKPESEAEDEAEDEVFGVDSTPNPSTRGMAIFWCGLFVTLPVTLAVLAVIFGGFAAIFGGLIALIGALVIVMIALIAAGAVCSLVGIIYGITQLFSFAAAGIYEIGLGITVAGAVLLLSVLIFNFAIRFLPFVIKKATVFFKFVMRKLKSAFFALRRECYKL